MKNGKLDGCNYRVLYLCDILEKATVGPVEKIGMSFAGDESKLIEFDIF